MAAERPEPVAAAVRQEPVAAVRPEPAVAALRQEPVAAERPEPAVAAVRLGQAPREQRSGQSPRVPR